MATDENRQWEFPIKAGIIRNREIGSFREELWSEVSRDEAYV